MTFGNDAMTVCSSCDWLVRSINPIELALASFPKVTKQPQKRPRLALSLPWALVMAQSASFDSSARSSCFLGCVRCYTTTVSIDHGRKPCPPQTEIPESN